MSSQFPASEYDEMRLCVAELAGLVFAIDASGQDAHEIFRALLAFPFASQIRVDHWDCADALHAFVVEAIKALSGKPRFTALVLRMLIATQAYEMARMTTKPNSQ